MALWLGQEASVKGRLTVVLDLDGTLISSYTPKRAPRMPPGYTTYVVGRGGRLNPGGVFVVERPGLARFFSRLAEFAGVNKCTHEGRGEGGGDGGRESRQAELGDFVLYVWDGKEGFDVGLSCMCRFVPHSHRFVPHACRFVPHHVPTREGAM